MGLSGVGSWLEREIIAQIDSIYRREDNLVGLSEQVNKLRKRYKQRIQLSQKYANLLSESGDHKQAREIYLDIIKRSPKNEDLKKDLLQILDKARDYEASRTLLVSLIALDQKDAELHVLLATVCEKLGDKEGVLKNLQRYKAKVSSGSATALRHASLLDKHGFKKLAVEAYEAVGRSIKMRKLSFRLQTIF